MLHWGVSCCQPPAPNRTKLWFDPSGEIGNKVHEKVDGLFGRPVAGTQFTTTYGGYGGVIDQQGVLWSSDGTFNRLLRLVPNPSAPPGTWQEVGDETFGNYGVTVSPVLAPGFNSGYVWQTLTPADQNEPDGRIVKIWPNGTLAGSHTHGFRLAQGVAVGDDGHVWVAHQMYAGSTVGHLDASGTWLGNVDLASGEQTLMGPTGVSIDSHGKVWAACYNDNSVVRIDPTPANGIGQRDLRISLGDSSTHPSGLDATPYNYSDMTGFNNHIVNPDLKPYKGYWTVVDDSGFVGMQWEKVSWTPVPTSGRIEVYVRAANSRIDLFSMEPIPAGNNAMLTGAKGRFIEVRVALVRDNLQTENPILQDLTVYGATRTLSIDRQPEPLLVPEHGAGAFDVIATGTDPITYQWLFNGQAITGATKATLVVSDVNCLDQGLYSVRVSDPSCETLESEAVWLTMQPALISINRHQKANPYPATISYSGPETASKVSVTLFNLSHPYPDDINILLVGPRGQAVFLMSHAGGNYAITPQQSVTLTFDDESPQALPNDYRISSGTYLPTAYGSPPPFPAPAPTEPPPSATHTSLSVTFNGTDPRGIWKLYIYDDGPVGQEPGRISGSWCLSITP